MLFGKKKPRKRVKTNKKPKVAPAKPSPRPPAQKPITPIPDKKETDIFLNGLSKEKSKEKKLDYHKEFLKTFQKLTYRHRAWDICCYVYVFSIECSK